MSVGWLAAELVESSALPAVAQMVAWWVDEMVDSLDQPQAAYLAVNSVACLAVLLVD